MMTREEATVYFEKVYSAAKEGLERHPVEGKRVYGMRMESAEIALTALRPVSREQVGKVFSGCPGCDSVSSKWEIKFCPFCGKPRTDEAVDMVMKRLEALKDAGD